MPKNKSTEKVERGFLALSPEKRAEALGQLSRLSENAPSEQERKQLFAVYKLLKNLNEKQNGGDEANEK